MCVCVCVLFKKFYVTTVVATGSQSAAVVVLHHGQEIKSGDLCNAICQHHLFIMCPCPKREKQCMCVGE